MGERMWAAKRAVSRLLAGGTANRVVGTTDGSNMIMTQIVDAMVAAGAGIAKSKLAALAIANADVAAGAAIAYSKLSLAASIVNADIAAGAAIAYSKLNLAASITNGDIAAAAAIAVTKLATGAAKTVLIGGASNSFSASPTVSGTLTAETAVKSGAAFYPHGQSDMLYDANTEVNVAAGGTVVIGTNISFGAIILHDTTTGNGVIVSLKAGAGQGTFATDSAATWNIGSDAGTTWAVFTSGANVVVKNRSGAQRSFKWSKLGD